MMMNFDNIKTHILENWGMQLQHLLNDAVIPYGKHLRVDRLSVSEGQEQNTTISIVKSIVYSNTLFLIIDVSPEIGRLKYCCGSHNVLLGTDKIITKLRVGWDHKFAPIRVSWMTGIPLLPVTDGSIELPERLVKQINDFNREFLVHMNQQSEQVLKVCNQQMQDEWRKRITEDVEMRELVQQEELNILMLEKLWFDRSSAQIIRADLA
jgi:hypothetical protein